jgi:hypothetical protein
LKTEVTAVACEHTGRTSTYNDNNYSTSADGPANAGLGNGLHGNVRGGRRLPGQVGAADVLAGHESTEPGSDSTSRQIRLLADLPVSAVPYGVLRDLAQAQIRRECRRWDFDWDAFVADCPEWGLTEVVHRRAVQQERDRGLDCRPTDIPTDTVLSAARGVIDEWTRQPALRPTDDDFRQEQSRRGEKGRELQQKLAGRRGIQVLALVAEGVCNNAEIGRRLGIDRSTVSRIRRKADAMSVAALQDTGDAPAVAPSFPAPEIPPFERWPIVQFTNWTGVHLDSDDARWLADMGRCYEAEGREEELIDAIRASAGAVRDPWAYLQRCVVNRGDAWTLTPQLLGDVLTWAGQKSLEYALTAIGGGYVKRPLPYLRRTLQCAVSRGKRWSGSPLRSVAMAVRMAQEWAPELVIVDADEAIAAEDAGNRTGYVEPVRRRFGRLPWEPEPVRETAAGLETSDVPNRCIGLKGLRGDDSNYQNLEYRNLESSPGSVKADATWAPCAELDLDRTAGSPDKPDARLMAAYGRALGLPTLEREKLEQPVKTGALHDSDVIRRRGSDGEARKLVQAALDPLPREKEHPVLEHGRCRHPLASLMAIAMVLDDVVLVECVAGCGHRLYSDRGPWECPCHWPPAKAARAARELLRDRAETAPAE